MATEDRLKPYRPILHPAGVDPSCAVLDAIASRFDPLKSFPT